MSIIKKRYCWNCGEDMGLIANRYYEPLDTCGKPECEHAAREAVRAEHLYNLRDREERGQ